MVQREGALLRDDFTPTSDKAARVWSLEPDQLAEAHRALEQLTRRWSN